MNEKEQPWYTSIVAVIIAMICFWPVGCVLLYLRIINNKGKYRGNTYMLITLAVILILFGIVGLVYFLMVEILRISFSNINVYNSRSGMCIF